MRIWLLSLFVGLTLALAAAPAAQAETLGAMHMCTAKSDGSVWCWGWGGYGQLGPGVPNIFEHPEQFFETVRSLPVQVPGVSGAERVFPGVMGSCALLDGGRLSCWGRTPRGDGSPLSPPFGGPATVTGLSDVIAAGVGLQSSCAVRADGRVFCWGSGGDGRIGDGNTADALTPRQVSGISDAVAVAVGSDFACAALTGGTVRCWGQVAGSPHSTPIPVPGLTGVSTLTTDGNLTCAIAGGRSLRCWDRDLTAVEQADLPGMRRLALAGGVICAVLQSGHVRCGGDNTYGTLGDGSFVSPAASTFVEPVGIDGAADAVVGAGWACAVHTTGEVSCWGSGLWGNLGNGMTGLLTSPVAEPGVSAPAQMIATQDGACVRAAGTVRCWGANQDDIFGAGPPSLRWSPAPVPALAGATGIAAASGSPGALCAIVAGAASCTDASSAPGPGAPVTDGVELALGAGFGCVRRGGGGVACWGTNGAGLGNGGTTSADAVAVSGLTDAIQVAAGGQTACALRSGGSVACWGRSLGNGSGSSSSTPVAVSGIATADAIVVTGDTACARLAAGTVFCWGDNHDGQIGDGGTGDADSPVQVAGVAGVAGLYAGRNTVCAVTDTAQTLCWGNVGPLAPLLGSFNAPDLLVAQHLAALDGAKTIVLRNGGGCLVAADDAVRCWGDNEKGGLGDGPMPTGHGPRPLPGRVAGLGAGGPGSDRPGSPGAPGSPADSSDPAQPMLPLPLTPLPAVAKQPPSLRLVGRTLRFTDYRVRRKGRGCPPRVTVRVKLGRKRITTTLRVTKRPRGVCVIRRATVRLPAAASRIKRLPVRFSGRSVVARTVIARRSVS